MPEKENPQITNKLRKDWNDYTDWLALRGMKGNPKLDKGGEWAKWIDKYKQENPNTLVSHETITPIQNEFQKYRQYALDEIKAGRGKFADGTNENNFMKALSIVDGIAGQRTTSFKFPSQYLDTFENGKLINTENKGFAVAKNK